MSTLEPSQLHFYRLTDAETALGRATVADRVLTLTSSRADARAVTADLLDMLGLTLAEAGPRVRLVDLEWRPDLSLKRDADAPAASAPPSPVVLRAREAARRRRRDAAMAHLRSQGLSGGALKNALKGMGL